MSKKEKVISIRLTESPNGSEIDEQARREIEALNTWQEYVQYVRSQSSGRGYAYSTRLAFIAAMEALRGATNITIESSAPVVDHERLAFQIAEILQNRLELTAPADAKLSRRARKEDRDVAKEVESLFEAFSSRSVKG